MKEFKYIIRIVVYLFVAISIFSCYSREATSPLLKAERALERDPSIAAYYIKMVNAKDLISIEDRHLYKVLVSFTSIDKGDSFFDTTSISYAKRYFFENGEFEKYLLAMYCQGVILENMGLHKASLYTHLRSYHIAREKNNKISQARALYGVSRVYSKQNLHEEAQNKIDLALSSISGEKEAYKIRSLCYQASAANYFVFNNFRKTKLYLDSCRVIAQDKRDSSLLNESAYLMARNYISQDIIDSASIYIDKISPDFLKNLPREEFFSLKLIQNINSPVVGDPERILKKVDKITPDSKAKYDFYSKVYSKSGKVSEAIEALKRYNEIADSTFTTKKTAIKAAEEAFEKEALENDISTQTQTRFYITWGFVFLLIIILTTISIYYYALRQKIKAKLRIKITEQQFYEDILSSRLEQIRFVTNILYQYGGTHLLKKKLKEIFTISKYKSNVIPDFIKLIDKTQSGVITKLKAEYPQLSEDDITICALILSGFSIKDITILNNYKSEASTFVRTNRIAKKMEISDSLVNFLKSFKAIIVFIGLVIASSSCNSYNKELLELETISNIWPDSSASIINSGGKIAITSKKDYATFVLINLKSNLEKYLSSDKIRDIDLALNIFLEIEEIEKYNELLYLKGVYQIHSGDVKNALSSLLACASSAGSSKNIVIHNKAMKMIEFLNKKRVVHAWTKRYIKEFVPILDYAPEMKEKIESLCINLNDLMYRERSDSAVRVIYRLYHIDHKLKIDPYRRFIKDLILVNHKYSVKREDYKLSLNVLMRLHNGISGVELKKSVIKTEKNRSEAQPTGSQSAASHMKLLERERLINDSSRLSILRDTIKQIEADFENGKLWNKKEYENRKIFGITLISVYLIISIAMLLFYYIKKRKSIYLSELERAELISNMQKKALDNRLRALKGIINLLYSVEKEEDINKQLKLYLSKESISTTLFSGLEELLDETKNSIISFIKNRYPNLNYEDIIFCCLIISGFTSQELSVLYNYKSETGVYTKSYRLAQKMGLETSLNNYLEQTVQSLIKQKQETGRKRSLQHSPLS